MKKILITLASILLVMGVGACSSDNNDNTTQETPPVVIQMIIDQPYTLNIGDEIKKISSDATVEITQNSQEADTEYTLVQGEAEIVRVVLF